MDAQMHTLQHPTQYTIQHLGHSPFNTDIRLPGTGVQPTVDDGLRVADLVYIHS